MTEDQRGPTPAPRPARTRLPASSETGITLDELDPRSRVRILDEAKKLIIADMRETLQAKASAENLRALKAEHFEEFRNNQKKRVLGFLTALTPLLDRFHTFAVKEIADRDPLDSVAEKFPGTALNRRQRMTVAGLLTSLGYQFTAREDGSGGEYLKGVINPATGALLGFRFEPAVKEQAKEYVADPANGLPRT